MSQDIIIRGGPPLCWAVSHFHSFVQLFHARLFIGVLDTLAVVGTLSDPPAFSNYIYLASLFCDLFRSREVRNTPLSTSPLRRFWHQSQTQSRRWLLGLISNSANIGINHWCTEHSEAGTLECIVLRMGCNNVMPYWMASSLIYVCNW